MTGLWRWDVYEGFTATRSASLTNGRWELDIATTDFDETIVAVANAGFVFEGWRKRDRGLFGGSAGKARLITKGFVGNADLMAVLASDETFYLEPVFRRVGPPENDPFLPLSQSLFAMPWSTTATSAQIRRSKA